MKGKFPIYIADLRELLIAEELEYIEELILCANEQGFEQADTGD